MLATDKTTCGLPPRLITRLLALALMSIVLALTITQPNAFAAEKREVVCWGDSLTAGMGASEAHINTRYETYDASNKSYPEILEHFTHLPTYNFGVSGAKSDEIAFMQGALKELGGSEDDEYAGDDGDDYAGDDGSPLIDERVMAEGAKHPGDVLVLEIGSNGGWDQDYDVLIAQYRAMIKHAGVSDYLIIGDTDNPGTSIADPDQKPFKKRGNQRATKWETALAREFGSHFINMRLYLIRNGLDDAGIGASLKDWQFAAQGCVSPKLKTDWTHLNSYGYYSKAKAIYIRGIMLGYWQ